MPRSQKNQLPIVPARRRNSALPEHSGAELGVALSRPPTHEKNKTGAASSATRILVSRPQYRAKFIGRPDRLLQRTVHSLHF
jgi:hypothetical protein